MEHKLSERQEADAEDGENHIQQHHNQSFLGIFSTKPVQQASAWCLSTDANLGREYT